MSMAVAADPVSPQEFEAMRANPSPTAQWTTVMAWYQADRIATSDQLNALVTETWLLARSPARDAGMSVSDLVRMFRTAGFITNREHGGPPIEPMRLYRGATRAGVVGFSWSPNRILASGFAGIEAFKHGSEEGVLCEAVIEPWQMLGIYYQTEEEVIVDPLTLSPPEIMIIPATTPQVLRDSVALMRWIHATQALQHGLKQAGVRWIPGSSVTVGKRSLRPLVAEFNRWQSQVEAACLLHPY